MARVLFVWELGSGLGHVRRIFPIAREVRALGHDVSIALRDSAFLDDARADGFEAFAAPILRAPADVNPSPLSHSEVLLSLGFEDARAVHGTLRGWRSLLELLAPQVVVADYAPAALVACGIAGLPRATVCGGFSIPPPGDPIPSLRSWAGIGPAVLQALDDRLVSRVRTALGPDIARAPGKAQALFAAELHLVCTFPELDPFGPREGVEYVGPTSGGGGIESHWEGEAPARVLAYLKPRTPRFGAVMAGLAALEAEVIVAAPGITPQEASGLSTERMRVFAEPVRLDPLLGRASLCVSHAGSAFAARSLAAGVPLALLPLQLEQFLIARRIEKSGAGAISSPEQPAPDFREWFTALLGSEAMHSAARRHPATRWNDKLGLAARRAAGHIAALAGK